MARHTLKIWGYSHLDTFMVCSAISALYVEVLRDKQHCFPINHAKLQFVLFQFFPKF